METSSLLWGLLFGSIGVAYVMYGRRQQHVVALVSGLLLIGFPYFVSGTVALIVTGGLLLAAPWLLKL